MVHKDTGVVIIGDRRALDGNGVGEGTSCARWIGRNGSISRLRDLRVAHDESGIVRDPKSTFMVGSASGCSCVTYDGMVEGCARVVAKSDVHPICWSRGGRTGWIIWQFLRGVK